MQPSVTGDLVDCLSLSLGAVLSVLTWLGHAIIILRVRFVRCGYVIRPVGGPREHSRLGVVRGGGGGCKRVLLCAEGVARVLDLGVEGVHTSQ